MLFRCAGLAGLWAAGSGRSRLRTTGLVDIVSVCIGCGGFFIALCAVLFVALPEVFDLVPDFFQARGGGLFEALQGGLLRLVSSGRFVAFRGALGRGALWLV